MSNGLNNQNNNVSEVSSSISRTAILLGLLAFLVRLIYIFELRACPFFDNPVIDAKTYLSQAIALAGGDILGRSAAFYGPIPYWQPPGYLLFLSVFVFIFGVRYFLLHSVGALIGAGTAVMTTLVASRVFGRRTAYLAGLFSAFCGPLVFFDVEFLAAGLCAFSLTVLLWVIINARNSLWRWFLAGILAGLTAVIVTTALVLLPLFAIWAAMQNKSGRKSFGMIAAMVLGTVLAIAPVTLRNIAIGKELVFLSTNAGLNFYIGNHPEKSFELQRIRPGSKYSNLIIMPEVNGVRTFSGRSNWFFRQSFIAIGHNPVGWLILKLKEAAIFLNGHEVMRNQDPYFYRGYSRLLAMLLWEKVISFPLGLMWPLGILGIILVIKKAPKIEDKGAARFLAAVILFYGSGVVLFFVTSRYRLPIIPLVLCFAAHAVIWLKDVISNKQWKSAIWSAFAIIIISVFCNLPAFRLDLYVPGENEFNLARVYYDMEKYDLSRTKYLESLEKWPDNVDALYEMGNIKLLVDIDPVRSLEWYDRAIKLDPLFKYAYCYRGIALSEMRRFPEAAESFRKAIELAPQWDVPKKALKEIAPYLNKNEPIK